MSVLLIESDAKSGDEEPREEIVQPSTSVMKRTIAETAHNTTTSDEPPGL